MKDIRILFMGTPVFATKVMQTLLDYGYNIVGLVSQPDKPVGRKKIIEPTPTKKVALEHNIPVYQFDRIKEHVEFLDEVKPDLIITCAYGQIVPTSILDYPKYGCINVHASLLPELRGGAPIHHAIIDGHKKTGVTIMEMTAKMDAGRMFSKVETEITMDDNLETLSERLSYLGSNLLIETLPGYLDGSNKGEEQDETKITFAWNIKKEEERIDWNKSALEIFNQIRGLYPSPAAYTTIDGKVFKIYKSEIVSYDKPCIPGSIVKCDKNVLQVGCKEGILSLLDVQMEGKTRVEIKQFLNGFNSQNKEFK